MKEDLKGLQRIINSDKAVLEWFKSVNNERTVYNCRADFPNFLRYIRENTEFRTPSEMTEARRKDLQSNSILPTSSFYTQHTISWTIATNPFMWTATKYQIFTIQ